MGVKCSYRPRMRDVRSTLEPLNKMRTKNDIEIKVLSLGIGLAVGIVLGVVVLNCLRIARANPVESLKNE